MNGAKQFIEDHDDFLVVSHIRPDGDAVSSTCAVGWILKQYNKRYTMINEGRVADKFQYLPGCSSIIDYTEHPPSRKFKYVITVDCAELPRVGKVSELFTDDVRILNIDHHVTNDRYGLVNLVDDQAAATVQLLYLLIEHMQLPWSEQIGNCIYTGLITDTGGFRYANTTAEVLHIAARMLTKGVNNNKLMDRLLETSSLAHILLLQKALAQLNFASSNRIAWMEISQADMRSAAAQEEDLEGIVNYARNITGVEVGILFRELEQQQIKISFRSAGLINVARFAQKFSGGGHELASGATVSGSMAEVTSQIIEALIQELQ